MCDWVEIRLWKRLIWMLVFCEDVFGRRSTDVQKLFIMSGRVMVGVGIC